MSKKLKLSPWHDGSVKPVRSGLYQRRIFGGISPCYFHQGKWYCYGLNVEDAIREFRNRNPSDKLVKWRGVLK
jgi:hypothetical protein